MRHDLTTILAAKMPELSEARRTAFVASFSAALRGELAEAADGAISVHVAEIGQLHEEHPRLVATMPNSKARICVIYTFPPRCERSAA